MEPKSKLQKMIEWALTGGFIAFWVPVLPPLVLSVMARAFDQYLDLLPRLFNAGLGAAAIGAIIGGTLGALFARDDPKP